MQHDLPTDPEERASLILRIVGSPDPRQIDGIGGAHPLTTKVAIVAPSSSDRADVEYLFLQPSVDRATVSDRQNCGNLLAGVGPFALERGLIGTLGDRASVRILMLNTNSVAVASFPTSDGLPVYCGDMAISGVPGTAAPIRLEFEDTVGATCGSLFPTGHAVDRIEGVECTLIDNGMPVAVIGAAALGVTGYESCDELEENEELRGRLGAIRLKAGRLMGLGDVSNLTVPKLTLVAAPRAGGAVCTRTFIPDRCHSAIGVFGAVTVATAVMVPGTPAAAVAHDVAEGSVVLEHPTGTTETSVTVSMDRAGVPTVGRAGIVRTARKLMDGMVFPRAQT